MPAPWATSVSIRSADVWKKVGDRTQAENHSRYYTYNEAKRGEAVCQRAR